MPVNDGETRYYLRTYRPAGSRSWMQPLWRPLDWMTSLGSRFILNQDKRVVLTQTPASSIDATADRLVGADRAVNQFRKIHARMIGGDAAR